MAKNKIQFQKGLSLPRFLSQYGTEEQCRQALFNMRWPQGFRCPKCGHTGYCEIRDRKVYQCHKCHFQTSLIQGTIFAATKIPLIGTIIPCVQFSGLLNPVSSLEGIGAFIGRIYPATHFLTISRGVFSKALDITHLTPSFWALLAAVPVILGLTVVLLKKQES